MRTIKELLVALVVFMEAQQKFQMHKNVVRGLCHAVHLKREAGSYPFDYNEVKQVERFLDTNLPKGSHKYNWPKYDLKVRIDWLNDQIISLAKAEQHKLPPCNVCSNPVMFKGNRVITCSACGAIN